MHKIPGMNSLNDTPKRKLTTTRDLNLRTYQSLQNHHLSADQLFSSEVVVRALDKPQRRRRGAMHLLRDPVASRRYQLELLDLDLL